jgi:hypothetical protein
MQGQSREDAAMTSQPADIQALARRLERVERQLRWWKRFGGAILTILVAVMLLAATGGNVPDEIRAKRFVLEDAKGKERAKLYISNDFRDAAFLTFIDNNGRERIRLGWYPLVDTSRLSFADEDGKENVALWTAMGRISMLNLEHGAASISLNVLPSPSFSQAQIDWAGLLVSGDTGTASLAADPGRGVSLELKVPAKDGKLRAELAVDDNGQSRQSLYDRDGNMRAALAVLPDGSPGLVLRDKDKKARAALQTPADGSPNLMFFDKDGKARAELDLPPNGSPSLSLYDKDGKARAVLGSTGIETIRTGETRSRTESSLVLFDKDGNVIWRTP